MLVVAASSPVRWPWPRVGLPVSHLVFLASAAEEPVPDDRYHAIYFAMLLAGVGFLLPYNSFITDVDHLHHKYPGGAPTGVPAPPGTPRGRTLLGSPFYSNPGSAVNC